MKQGFEIGLYINAVEKWATASQVLGLSRDMLSVESDLEFAPCDLGTSRDLNFSIKNERYMMEDPPGEEIFGVPDRPWPLASKN